MASKTASALQDHWLLFDEPLWPDDLRSQVNESRAAERYAFIDKVPSGQGLSGPEASATPKLGPGPFSIAVFGDWGSGKSSLLKALAETYRRKNHIVVEFEPWRCEQEENLVLPRLVEFQAAINGLVKSQKVKQAAPTTTKKLLGRVAKGVLRKGGEIVKAHIGGDPCEIGEEFFKTYAEQQRD